MWFLVSVFTISCNMKSKIIFLYNLYKKCEKKRKKSILFKMHEESICVISIPIHRIWVMLTPFDLLQGHLRSAQKKIKPLVVF